MSATARPCVLHVFWSFAPAGPELRTVALIEALGPAWSHVIAARDGRLDALAVLPEGLDVRGLPAVGYGFRAWRKLILCERPALLCTYNWGSFDAVLAARSLRLRTHLHHENGFEAEEAGRQKLRRVWVRRAALPYVHRVIVPSRLLERIARQRWRLPAERVVRVRNGVDLARFRPAAPGGEALRAELGIPQGAFVVGAVGGLRRVKRFDRLIRVCAVLPAGLAERGVHLVIAGEGPERGALEALARTQRPPGGAVHLLGHRTDLVPVYRALDVFSLSSDTEQLPLSLLEAMACGAPVIATDVGDLRAVLPEEGHAGLVARDAAELEVELAQRLAQLLAQPRRRERLAALGRARVEQEHSGSAMLAAYRQLYVAALEAAPASQPAPPARRLPSGADGSTLRSPASARGNATRRAAR
jgi:glycosyltransferase involved in cell wall biosynthesis